MIRLSGWARALLDAVLPPDEAAAVVGDLEEGMRRRAERDGERAARRWVAREVLAYALHFAPDRLRRARPSIRTSDMMRDLRFALRRILRQPGFSFVVIATLAVGIAGNAAIFGVVDSVLLRPLPLERPDELVALYGTSASDENAGGMFNGYLPFSYPNFEDVRDASTTLDGMFVHSLWPVSVETSDGSAERVDGLYVSASYFDVLGVRPVAGRTFRTEEDRSPGADAVVVLQHGYWLRQFAGDPAAVGRTITLNGRTMEIVGVAPPGFRGTDATLQPEVFVPVSMVGDVPPWGPLYVRRGLRFFMVGGRMAPGRSVGEVRAEMEALGARLSEAYPDINGGRGIQVLPGADARIDPNRAGALSRTGIVLMIMSGLVLLIACMNVANLMLARTLSRRVELAVRSSLGASRGRLARELTVESTLLFGIGAATGVALAVAALSAVDGLEPPAFFGGSLDVGLDWRVLAFTLVSTFLCAGLFGVGPAIRGAKAPTAGRLRSRQGGVSSRGRRLRDVLVAGQVALSVVSLAAAGNFARSLHAARQIDPGFGLEGLGMMSVDLAAQGIEGEEATLLYQRMAETAAALPTVRSAAVGGARPLAPAPLRRITRVDQDRTDPSTGHYIRVEIVTADFFETVELPVEEGRALDGRDGRDTPPAAVVNRRLADMLWPDGGVVGERAVVSLVDDPLEVVGVAGTAKTVALDEEPQPVLYLALAQHEMPTGTIFVRLAAEGGLEDARRAVQALDPSLPIFSVATADEVVEEALWTASATTRVLAVFGLVGLFLAAVGIYGVVAHSVRERTREMGLRLALGSSARQVVLTSVGRMLAVAGVGAVLGIAAAVVSAGVFADILVGVAATDPLPLLAVAAALLLVAGFAAWLPARRATRVDPMIVLRSE